MSLTRGLWAGCSLVRQTLCTLHCGTLTQDPNEDNLKVFNDVVEVMRDLWLISVPLDKTSVKSVEKLQHIIGKTNHASCYKFTIPDLKVGILDSLLSVSDELYTLDALTESVLNKTCQCMREMMEQDEVMANVLADGGQNTKPRDLQSPFKDYMKSLRVGILNYVTNFHWDKAKYPTSLPLSSLVNIINKEVSQVETELKSRAAVYNSVNASLQCLEPTSGGSLQTCSLNGMVRREDLVVSEYLTSLLAVVSRGDYVNWEQKYESLSEFVVPRSSRKLYEDGEWGIFSVTLFKRDVYEFKAKAQESKFTVREYCFDLEEKQQREWKELRVHGKQQYGVFVHWLKVNFSQVFMAWIHLKAARVFVESVLRYGLPVNYQALLLQSDRKCSEKLRQELASLFLHLDPTANVSETDVTCDIPGLFQQEYFSYICFYVNTNMLDFS
ncbi:V-type proton ATPase subunit C 1-B isoform X2 [Syngnathus scovelli]|uniref:V-type proton ATPase subunit C 1-B isoform X2 n=1 Tax=Syngnathus scovelli TaxID=161590 RepID=UPI00210F4CED|nr:V-type proton ATPase subunit C 1-B isoform X2 [Syngnathus scovelli]